MRWSTRWTNGELGRRLTTAFTALALAAALMCVAAFWSTARLSAALNRSVRHTARSQQSLGALLAAVNDMKASAYADQIAIVISYMEKGSRLEGSCTACHDASMRSRHVAAFDERFREARLHLDTLRNLAGGAQGAHVRTIETALASWDALESEYTRKASAGDFDGAHLVLTEGIQPLIVNLENAAASLSRQGSEELSAAAADGESMSRSARWLVLALCILSVPVAAAGIRIVIHTAGQLRDCGSNLSGVAGRLLDSATRLASNSESLAAGVEQEGACLKQTAHRGVAVRQQAAANAAHARDAERKAAAAAAATTEASSLLAEMVDAMNAIDTTSQKVAGILKVMDEIASQTNLLALNASVEAARAGQAGLGFAVVAEEVRSLAQRSTDAARETAALVDASRARSAEGRRLSEMAKVAVESIREQSAAIEERLHQVASSSEDQARSLETVKASIEELERLAALNEDIAQNSAADAGEVAGGGRMLESVVRRVEQLAGA